MPSQGEGAPASPILTFPKGKERHTTTSNTAGRSSRPLGRAGEGPPVGLPPLGEGWGGAASGTPAPWGGLGEGLSEGMGRGFRKQQQLCRSCVSPAQGCGRSTLPWVSTPTNLATLQELRLAEGVILNLMISTNPFLPIILLRVTPSANRNTYSVATPYYICTFLKKVEWILH